MFSIIFTNQASKDLDKIKKSNFKNKLYNLLEIIEKDPFQPPYEKLSGYVNTYSRRLNKQHRLVYELCDKEIKIISTWTHYENI